MFHQKNLGGMATKGLHAGASQSAAVRNALQRTLLLPPCVLQALVHLDDC